MDNFIFSFNVVAPLFVLMVAGFVLRAVGFLPPAVLSASNKLLFKLLLPLMLFQNLRQIFENDFSNFNLALSALSGVVLLALVAIPLVCLCIKRPGQRGTMIQGIFRSNFLIYGVPLVTGVYGTEATPVVALVMAMVVPFYNIASVVILSLFSETRTTKLSAKTLIVDVFKNPLLLGCLAGLLFGFLHIPLPNIINRPIHDLSMSASALALFIMGGEIRIAGIKDNLWKTLAVTVTRLVIVPLVAMVVYVYMGYRDLELVVLLCIFATPTAVMSYIMAENMGCDSRLAAQIVMFTTLLSVFTIFMFVFFLKNMMLI